jgi:hypothetical protein
MSLEVIHTYNQRLGAFWHAHSHVESPEVFGEIGPHCKQCVQYGLAGPKPDLPPDPDYDVTDDDRSFLHGHGIEGKREAAIRPPRGLGSRPLVRPLYHGTRHVLARGDVVEARSRGYAFGIYDAERAHGFAHDANGDGQPRVYQVQPTGPPEYTPNSGWFKSRSPLRVIREVAPPAACPECELEDWPQPAEPGLAGRSRTGRDPARRPGGREAEPEAGA